MVAKGAKGVVSDGFRTKKPRGAVTGLQVVYLYFFIQRSDEHRRNRACA